MIDAADFLMALDLDSFVRLFWFGLIFEVPRFVLGAMAVAAWIAVEFFYDREEPKADDDLSVCVIVSAYNSEASIDYTIASLNEQTTPCEIIAVDDGSTDGTRRALRDLKRDGRVDVFIPLARRSGKSAAVNAAISHTDADIICIVDSDTSFDRDAIEELTAPFSDPDVGAVSGNIGLRNEDVNLLTMVQSIEYLMGISLGRRVLSMLGILTIASGAFGAFRREAVISVGAQDIDVGEDADLTLKLRRAGWTVAFAPDAWALTDGPETLLGLTKQRLRWDRGIVTHWMRKYRENFDPRSAGFTLSDAMASFEVLLFQPLLNLMFFGYLIWLVWLVGEFAWVIIGATLIGYAVMTSLTFVLAGVVSRRKGYWHLVPFVPVFIALNLFYLRPLRFVAYFDELAFRRSYRDSYVPQNVLDQAEVF